VSKAVIIGVKSSDNFRSDAELGVPTLLPVWAAHNRQDLSWWTPGHQPCSRARIVCCKALKF
jgi:hypothetical protein